MQRNHAELLQRGTSPLLTLFDADGHDCWTAAYRMTALYGWLLEQSRSNNARQIPFEYLPPSRLIQVWDEAGTGTWSAGDDDVLVGQGHAGENLLIAADSSAGYEIHGETWLSADSVREVGLFGEDPSVTEPEYRLSLMLPHQGNGGIVRSSDGEWLADLDLAAQHWLRTDTWNDVRIRWHQGRLSVRLNGWPAADVELGRGESGDARFRMALVAPADGSEVLWRYVRTRELGDSALARSERTE